VLGVCIQRLLIDNGWAYCSQLFTRACQAMEIKHQGEMASLCDIAVAKVEISTKVNLTLIQAFLNAARFQNAR
jgi:hypothetical protein